LLRDVEIIVRFKSMSCAMTGIVRLAPEILAMMVMVMAVSPLHAGDVSPQDQYKKCMEMIEHDAEKAFDQAIEWRDLGGGAPSEHCIAAALLALEYYTEAAGRLEELAQQPTDDLGLRLGLLRQAAQGWSLAEKPERAYAALTAALQLDGKNPKLLIERAVVQADMGLYDKAVDDLSVCLSLDPLSADAYTFRASAYRYLDRLDLAVADVDHALTLEPDHLEARLERGIVRRLQGDDAGARQDWVHILEIASGAEVSQLARRNLELLDIKAE